MVELQLAHECSNTGQDSDLMAVKGVTNKSCSLFEYENTFFPSEVLHRQENLRHQSAEGDF